MNLSHLIAWTLCLKGPIQSRPSRPLLLPFYLTGLLQLGPASNLLLSKFWMEWRNSLNSHSFIRQTYNEKYHKSRIYLRSYVFLSISIYSGIIRVHNIFYLILRYLLWKSLPRVSSRSLKTATSRNTTYLKLLKDFLLLFFAFLCMFRYWCTWTYVL